MKYWFSQQLAVWLEVIHTFSEPCCLDDEKSEQMIRSHGRNPRWLLPGRARSPLCLTAPNLPATLLSGRLSPVQNVSYSEAAEMPLSA